MEICDIDGVRNPMDFIHSYLLEILELLIPREPLLLVHAPVDGDGGEVLLDEELREGDAPLHALDEDDHLWKTDGRLEFWSKNFTFETFVWVK